MARGGGQARHRHDHGFDPVIEGNEWRDHARLWSRLPAYKGRVERSREIIREFLASHGPLAVAYSYGKDSSVMLHMVRTLDPSVRAYYVAQGGETPDTAAFRAEFPEAVYGAVDVVDCDVDLDEAVERYGWYTHEPSRVQPKKGAWRHNIRVGPYERYHEEHGIRGVFVGLRSEESRGRAMLRATRGHVYEESKPPRCWPLLDWGTKDVWAYIGVHDLPYNPAYDREHVGFDRHSIRVAPIFVEGGHRTRGLFEWMRMAYPAWTMALKRRLPLLFEGVSRWKEKA